MTSNEASEWRDLAREEHDRAEANAKLALQWQADALLWQARAEKAKSLPPNTIENRSGGTVSLLVAGKLRRLTPGQTLTVPESPLAVVVQSK